MDPKKVRDPVTVVQISAKKAHEAADREATWNTFKTFLFLLFFFHLAGHLLIVREGISGYALHWKQIFGFLLVHPYLIPAVGVAFAMLWRGIHDWRHRFDVPDERVLDPPPPVPDLRWNNNLYIGTGLTYDGKQPGDVVGPEEEVLENPHLILKEAGLFGNLHVLGGVGGGKTSTFIMPVLDQSIMKWPKPLPPEHFKQDKKGRFLPVDLEDFRKLRIAEGGPEDLELDPFDRRLWNPYEGMTAEDATAEYQRRLEEHLQNKWAVWAIDPKGDLTGFIMKAAKAAGREDDVIVLRPDGEYTYNAMAVNNNPLVMSEMVMDGIEAVTGQTMHQYYRQTASEWLANALSILKAANPAKVSMKTVLTMAQSEDMATRWVAEAEARLREAQAEEERLRRMGKPYTGIRVNPAAVDFWKDWLDPDSDVSQKKAVVSGIKAQAKFFVESEMAPFLCPEMPPTFEGFEKMIDKGQIVVLRMPLDTYGAVAKVMGVLMLADAQQAARARINKPEMNQQRVVLFAVDECQNYVLQRLTKEFVSMNRQSRVCCLFAHQTTGQLLVHGDRSFENSFNDNLRTKISYSAPNAEAGSRLSKLFGARKVLKEVYSESTTDQRVEFNPGGDSYKAKGGQSKGASVRFEEVERYWFMAEDFVGLSLGECIVSEFDGITTLTPRKVNAPKYWETPRGKHVLSLPLDERRLRPHPIVHVGTTESDFEYLDTGLTQTGYIVASSLFDAAGELAGIKFVTEAGTLIVPLHLLTTEHYEVVGDRLSDSQCTVVLTDMKHTLFLLHDECNIKLERFLPLPFALSTNHPETGLPLYNLFPQLSELPESFHDFFRALMGSDLAFPQAGSWEFHQQRTDEAKRAIIYSGRSILDLYTQVLDVLSEHIGEDGLEDLFAVMREAAEDALIAPSPVTSEAGAEPEDDVTETPVEPMDPPIDPDHADHEALDAKEHLLEEDLPFDPADFDSQPFDHEELPEGLDDSLQDWQPDSLPVNESAWESEEVEPSSESEDPSSNTPIETSPADEPSLEEIVHEVLQNPTEGDALPNKPTASGAQQELLPELSLENTPPKANKPTKKSSTRSKRTNSRKDGSSPVRTDEGDVLPLLFDLDDVIASNPFDPPAPPASPRPDSHTSNSEDRGKTRRSDSAADRDDPSGDASGKD